MNATIIDRDTRLSDIDADGNPIVAHIVITPGGNAAATILEARVLGLTVEAICGTRWIPQRDPSNYPKCQACQEIYAEIRKGNGDLHSIDNVRQ